MLLCLFLLVLTSFTCFVSELNLKCVSLDALDDVDEFYDLGGFDGYDDLSWWH